MDRLIDRLPDTVEQAVKAFLQRACDRSFTIATAESCTGGLLAALLTDVEGCSHAFERGFVAYSEQAKAELLGVAPSLIASDGAVSKAVALAMARGALFRSEADIALAVTGFAGPASPADEVGLVHLACIRRNGGQDHRELHLGDRGRGEIRIESVRVALAMMDAALG